MNSKSKLIGLLTVTLCSSRSAHAAVSPDGLLDSVADRLLAASSGWASVITAYSSWLFWALATISLVWTIGMKLLQKADIGELFAEFLRFTVFTGFYWWLLKNGPAMAIAIMDSLRTIGAEASAGGMASAFARAGKVTASAAAGLAQGAWSVAKESAVQSQGAAQERIAGTLGGRIATAIDASAGSDSGEFQESGNSLAQGRADLAAEVAAFVNRTPQEEA